MLCILKKNFFENIFNIINELSKKGAKVIYEGMADIHVSGHAKAEELKLMLSIIKPEYFMPVHGEYMHLNAHKELAMSLGIPKENIFIMEIGDVLEIGKNDARVNGTVPSGQVLVDGLGVGDVGNIVLRDRRHLSQDGLIVVVVTIDKEGGYILSGPDIISRGFVYVRESEELMSGARQVVEEALMEYEFSGYGGWSAIKNIIRDSLKNYIWQKTKRSPMILPIIMDA